MSISFKHLEIFNAVVVAGSISKATRLTGLSQPTISQQLAKFEEELGTLLIQRRRSNAIELTPSGEYWFNASNDLLRRRDEVEAQHEAAFRSDRMTLRFGATPSLRGIFTETAARLAIEQGRFARFDYVWGLNSDEIVELIDTHAINCAVVSATAVEGHRGSLSIVPLFRDRIVWVVPAKVPHAAVAEAIATGRQPAGYEALGRYVAASVGIPWHKRTAEWYRTRLPFAQPYFGCMTHQVSVDFVAAGLATCHCPLSLLPNLPESVRARLQTFDLQEFGREAVFAMPRHLQSLKPFHDFQAALCDFAREHYREGVSSLCLAPVPGDAPLPSPISLIA